MTEPCVSEMDRFVVTKEYRRFEEFCEACRRERYIGLCYGLPGVGKTMSARRYARWDLIEGRDPFDPEADLSPILATCRALVITPGVTNSPRSIREQVEQGEIALRGLAGRAGRAAGKGHDFDGRCDLILVDEADWLTTQSLEELRDHYDRGGLGLILIGMPGFEKRLARYPQLYSRVGFAHAFRPLGPDEMLFVLQSYWRRWGGTWTEDEFTDREAHAAIVRVTAGNFRLVDRLMGQIVRIKRLNHLNTVTKEVVEAARECLVIGKT